MTRAQDKTLTQQDIDLLLKLTVMAANFRIDKHSPIVVDLLASEEMKEYGSS
jgi:hypothetical protein